LTSVRRYLLPIPLAAFAFAGQQPQPAATGAARATAEAQLDREFMAVPDAALARQHLKTLTAAPHWASSPEDYATAAYVAAGFKAAGLETQIVPYSVPLAKPVSLAVEAFDSSGAKILPSLTPESPQPDPRSLPPFSSGSPAADLTAPIVYANYGSREDYARLAEMGVSVKGKIALIRYGQIFRGTKVYLAQQAGAAGVLLFTDPADASTKGTAAYPDGRNPPPAAVQRGSVQFLPIYPGDPTTPGVASVPGLPAASRIPLNKLQYDLPSIPSQPISTADAAPILRALAGPLAPREWQGAALGAPYHVGSVEAPVTVRMRLAFDTRLRTIWDVIGRIPGTVERDEWVVAGNHRDAWVYGATDPSSGTAAMLEAVHGLGVLLKHGWRPRRTIVIGSWDGEEEGLIGSTEWVEQHKGELEHAVAYFNIDEAASGPAFHAAAVPSLREFVRKIAAEVPAAAGGGSVLDHWVAQEREKGAGEKAAATEGAPVHAAETPGRREANSGTISALHFGDLGSGSDYSPFLDHAGVPSADVGSDGLFGVYHSAYDSFDWFTRFVDPDFALTVQQARVFGLEILHMANAEVLPLDEAVYAEAIHGYLEQARRRSSAYGMNLDFAAAVASADSFAGAARAVNAAGLSSRSDAARLNAALIAAEHALVVPEGLPLRPWYRQAVYAPGLATGYAPEELPGVNDAIDAKDARRAQDQLAKLVQAMNRAAGLLAAASR
jgi:N-acetylated-alpha-linked acidic dipeptidase